jgi:hypothetical protein
LANGFSDFLPHNTAPGSARREKPRKCTGPHSLIRCKAREMQAHCEVVVPEGKKSGETMLFMIPSGQHMKLQVPDNVKAGDKIRVQIPNPSPQELNSWASHNTTHMTVQNSMTGGQSMLPIQQPVQDVYTPIQGMQNSVPHSGPGSMLLSTRSHRYIGRTTMAFCLCTPLGWWCIPLCFPCDDHVTLHSVPYAPV